MRSVDFSLAVVFVSCLLFSGCKEKTIYVPPSDRIAPGSHSGGTYDLAVEQVKFEEAKLANLKKQLDAQANSVKLFFDNAYKGGDEFKEFAKEADALLASAQTRDDYEKYFAYLETKKQELGKIDRQYTSSSIVKDTKTRMTKLLDQIQDQRRIVKSAIELRDKLYAEK
jgi:hypothetical protein